LIGVSGISERDESAVALAADLEGPASGDGIAHGSLSFNFGSCRIDAEECIPHDAAGDFVGFRRVLLPFLEAAESDVAAVLPIVDIV